MASFSVKLMQNDDILLRLTKKQQSKLSKGSIMLFRVHHIVQHPDHQDHRVTIKTLEELQHVDDYDSLSASYNERFMANVMHNILQLHIDSHGRFLSHNGEGVQLVLSGLLDNKPIPVDRENTFDRLFKLYITRVSFNLTEAGYRLVPILIDHEVVRYHQYCDFNEATAWWQSTPINPNDLVPAVMSSPSIQAEYKIRRLFRMCQVMTKWFCFGGRPKECFICLQKFPLNMEIAHLYCMHAFHEHCITDWFKKSYTCPVCRFSFDED